MKLNKRYRRSIVSNLSFYISASVLTMISLLLFFLFYIAGTGINKYGDEFFERNNIEQANFSTLNEIPDNRISELEKKYSVTLQKEHFINLKEDDYNVRVFKANDKIDLCEVIEGRDAKSNDEVVISAGYAQNMGVSVGDKVHFSGKDFTVTGTFLRPDYLYMLENLSDDYKNIDSFFLAEVTDECFDELYGNGSISYKVIYNDSEKETEFRKAVYDEFFTMSYIGADENTRISMVHQQADMFVVMSWIMLVTLPLITVALISIIIGRKVKSEQKIVGTLSALGYKKSKLMFHYSLMAIIPGIAGGLLMALACLIVSQPFGELGLADYEPMQVEFSLPVPIAVAGIIIPSLIYMIAGMMKVRKLLKNDTVELLSGNVGNKSKTHRMLMNSGMKVKYKFAIRSLLGSKGRTFVIFLGILLGTMFSSFGYMMVDSIKEVSDVAKSECGDFKNEYVLNTMLSDEKQEGEKMLMMSFENNDKKQFSVIGADDDCTLWNLTTTDGEKADIENGWYMSTLAADLFGIKKGDSFTFKNVASLEEYTVKIDGFIKNGYQSYIISNRKDASDIIGIDAENYNCILSDKDLDIENDLIAMIIKNTTFENQMQTILDEMGVMIYSLIVLGAVICISALYVSINMMVQESRNNVSMLKVLGYQNKQINAMVLNSNHLLLIPGISIGLVGTYLMMLCYSQAFVELEGMVVPIKFNISSIILTILIVTACYFVSLFFVRRKVDKIDMVESLKDNRE